MLRLVFAFALCASIAAARADETAPPNQTTEPSTTSISREVKEIFDKAGKEKMKSYKSELSAEEINDLVAYVRKFKT